MSVAMDKIHQWFFLVMSAVVFWTSCCGQQGGLQCLDCIDVVHPVVCSRSTLCQQDEMCFTYKYTYSNVSRYNLGCQDHKVCEMIPLRPFLIGRRRTAIRLGTRNDVKITSLCYDCCHSNNCNREMCQGHGVTKSTTLPLTMPSSMSTTTSSSATTPSSTTIPTSATTTTATNTLCPSNYVGFEASCYMIVYKSLHWDRAETACTQMGKGTHLVSVNSEKEQQFLAHLLNAAGFPARGVWIGGYQDPFWRRWTWSDGSTFQYQSWVSPFPLDERRRTSISMVNPSVSSDFKGWLWRNETPDQYFAFICEMKNSD
ncbi:uncharacterized protein LOC124131234 isoform X2 [Haliotis rufescens]|uniref:uncharacterized protein LOC124131234 isoform X2 n=1 Tax=Haliotis rufescens TaxID=6454 RepID=UPI00201EAF14|nr:uncharacterized protein LOC124131234 isoform X2 [Haliotis rufescens]